MDAVFENYYFGEIHRKPFPRGDDHLAGFRSVITEIGENVKLVESRIKKATQDWGPVVCSGEGPGEICSLARPPTAFPPVLRGIFMAVSEANGILQSAGDYRCGDSIPPLFTFFYTI